MMKKYAPLAMLLIVCILLSACGNASSGITITDFENAFREVDSSISFRKVKTDDGYTFQYTQKQSFGDDITYTGVSDANENVISISVTYKDVDISILRSTSKLSDLVSKNALDLYLSEYYTLSCVMGITCLREALSKDNSNITPSAFHSEVVSLFSGKSVKIDKWTITAKYSSDTVTITAQFN